MQLINVLLLALTSGCLAGWYSYRNQVARGRFIGQLLDMIIMVGVTQLPVVGLLFAPPIFYLYSMSLVALIIYFVGSYITPQIKRSNMFEYAYRSPDEATTQRLIRKENRIIMLMRSASFGVLISFALNLFLYYYVPQAIDFSSWLNVLLVYLIMERVVAVIQAFWSMLPGFWDVINQAFWAVVWILQGVHTPHDKERLDRGIQAGLKAYRANMLRLIFTLSNVFLLALFARSLGVL